MHGKGKLRQGPTRVHRLILRREVLKHILRRTAQHSPTISIRVSLVPFEGGQCLLTCLDAVSDDDLLSSSSAWKDTTWWCRMPRITSCASARCPRMNGPMLQNAPSKASLGWSRHRCTTSAMTWPETSGGVHRTVRTSDNTDADARMTCNVDRLQDRGVWVWWIWQLQELLAWP